MKKAYLFPGQGAQFEGMGKDLYEQSELAKELFDRAGEVLGFDIAKVMFEGSAEDLRQTKITQPAIFLHSVITAKTKMEEGDIPDAVAGHSLGEFSALVFSGALDFEDGLKLVYQRALAMQEACEATEGTMVAAMSKDIEVVEAICSSIEDVVVPANYNSPGQLVVSGSIEGIKKATELLEEKKIRVIPLSVGGAFHSPLMQMAQEKLQAAIESTTFKTPKCPIYQNVDAQPTTNVAVIKQKLIEQLTGAVRWQQTLENFVSEGFDHFVEVGGKGKILLGMVKRVARRSKMEMLA